MRLLLPSQTGLRFPHSTHKPGHPRRNHVLKADRGDGVAEEEAGPGEGGKTLEIVGGGLLQ